MADHFNAVGCEEVIVPEDFNHMVDYVNDAGEPRKREMTGTELDAALTYSEKRFAEYPSIASQLDMLWHAMDNGALPKVDAFYDAIKDVKDKYPKSA